MRSHRRRPALPPVRAAGAGVGGLLLVVLVVVLVVALLLNGGGPARRPSLATHVETWAYDDSPNAGSCNGGAGASAQLVRAWLTYAEANCGPWRAGHVPPAVRACHVGGRVLCRVMAYVDTSLVYRDTPPGHLLANAREAWFAHEPAPHETVRVTTAAAGGGYLMNQADAAYRAWWRGYVRRSYPTADGLFMDDQSPELPFFGLSSARSAEIASARDLRDAQLAMARALTRADGRPYPQIDNTIPDCGNPYVPDPGIGPTGTILSPPVEGLVAEGCPIDDGTITPYYADLLDDVAAVLARPSGLIVLLAYAPRRVVVWPDLEQDNRDLAVWPEQGLYPTRPVQTMSRPGGPGCLAGATGGACTSGGHTELEIATRPGIYRREFAACADRGAAIGPCAAIVNTTAAPVLVQPSWLTQRYRSEITFTIPPHSSGDVQTGGAIDLAGVPFSAGRSVIAPHDAMLLDARAASR